VLACPVCGSKNVTKTVYIAPTGERENILCLSCGQRSLVGFVKHLVLFSGNFAIKIKGQKVAINGHRLTFENGVTIDKINGRYIASVLGEPMLLTFGTRLRPRNPPYPLSLLK
jgi:uncharacterized Zn-binding protein involved in type VI secretion